MPSSAPRPVLLALMVPLMLAAAPASRTARPREDAPDTWSGVERVVAVGDVHGDVDALKAVLRMAGLIDARGHWSGGKAHLVQTGDIPDRGDQTREAYELLMRLEKEALAAGGRVHALIGNHEAMNMLGDLRYTTPGELASFADLASAQEAAAAPGGLAGHRAAYGPTGRYGRWLRTHAAVVCINGTLFVHGGISPEVPFQSVAGLNQWVRQDFTEGQPPGGARASEGPLWFRGYALGEEDVEALLDRALERLGARRMVMGHTTEHEGRIRARWGGKAVFIDTGLSTGYGHHLAALELRADTLTALYPEGRVALSGAAP